MPAGSDGTNVEGTLLTQVRMRPELRTAYARTGNIAGWTGFGLGIIVLLAARFLGRPQVDSSTDPNAKG